VSNPRPSFPSDQPSVHGPEPERFDESIFEQAARSGVDTPPDQNAAPDPGNRPTQREGLPAGFRMRHDAHYVDELMSGVRPRHVVAIGTGEAESARRSTVQGRAAAAPAPKAYAEVGESLEAIGTCLQLFGRTARPPAERLALDLIEAETARAAWLVQALSILDDEPPMANAPVDLDAVLGHVARVMDAARARQGGSVEIQTEQSGLRARGDTSLVTLAVAAITAAVQSAADHADGAVVRVRIADDAAGRVRIEAAEDAVRIPASWRARFLDPEWAERPGGRRVAILLSAARRIAELHRGALTMGGADHGGCCLVLSLARS
jgi:hypothetical protein